MGMEFKTTFSITWGINSRSQGRTRIVECTGCWMNDLTR